MPTKDDARRLGVGNADELKALLDDDKNYSAWKVVDGVGNRFNRSLLFHGVRYHQSAEYFGMTLKNGRLFQTFFFGLALNCFQCVDSAELLFETDTQMSPMSSLH
jgi:hypothetical protein